ncbi:MAG TPA: membrane dipeptidase [Trueperaceae bacterium]|nr:membrane dipeptidase [Trueperaceae bacterium]
MKQSFDDAPIHPLDKGHHTKGSTPYLFVDSCVQIWPDTDYSQLHEYSATAYCITTFRPNDGAENALDAIANWHRIAADYPGIRIAESAEDITEAKASGQAAIVINSQGGDFLGPNLQRLAMFHRLGLRMMIPAYNTRSTLADGLLEPAGAGLSNLGREWVTACNDLGIVMDMTHVGERSSLEVLSLSEDPVVFSHSNPRALVDNVRNVTDEQIRLAAGTGGLVAPTNWGPLNYRLGSDRRPTLSEYIDAIDYIVELVGIDHVGIGTDMSYGTYPDGDLIRGLPGKSLVGGDYARFVEVSPRSKLRYVEGFDDYSHLPDVINELEKRGYQQPDIAKVLGGNWLRIFKEVW